MCSTKPPKTEEVVEEEEGKAEGNAGADVDGEIKHTNVLKLANILANCPYKY